MSELRLYPMQLGPRPECCAGCDALMSAYQKIVYRQDGAKFCAESCAKSADDAPLRIADNGRPQRPARV